MCRSAIYRPCDGHVPRTFGGAKCTLEDVKLVMVSNGPAWPIQDESYSGNPEEDLRILHGDRYINSKPQSIHVNLNLVLDSVFRWERGLEN